MSGGCGLLVAWLQWSVHVIGPRRPEDDEDGLVEQVLGLGGGGADEGLGDGGVLGRRVPAQQQHEAADREVLQGHEEEGHHGLSLVSIEACRCTSIGTNLGAWPSIADHRGHPQTKICVYTP